MSKARCRVRRTLPRLLLVAPLLVGVELAADDEKAEKEQREKRLEFMAKIVESFGVKPGNPQSAVTGRFHEQPIMRYSDAPRGMLDATIWKMGKQGRPEAIVTLEMHRRQIGPGLLSYEFLSLAPETFRLTTSRGWTWRPVRSTLQFRRFAEAPAPGKTRLLRLRQARRLARQFSASERYGGETYALRLLPRPIDRYLLGDGDDEKETGAIFAFVHGTNPELLLLIETNQDGWQYGFGRLAGAALTVKLDEKIVWTRKGMGRIGYSSRNSYTATRHSENLP